MTRADVLSAGGDTAGVARWLGLAATPTFAVMALVTGLLDQGPMDVLCSAGHGSPLSGMASMYLLMSAFHSPPWLKLISGQRRAFRPCRALARLTRCFKDPANQSELGPIEC